jgi:ribbon-helix-helix protein
MAVQFCQARFDKVGTPEYTRLEMVTKKIRTVFYLDRAERKTFDKLSKKTGAPLAELLRRAVAMYLKAQRKRK